MILYTATFPSGKVYVGVTTRTLAHRKSDHKRHAAKGVDNKFYRAIRRHGFDSISWQIVGRFESVESMFAAERALISKLDTIKSGYNTTTGGEGNPGRFISAEERARHSQAQRQRYSNPLEREKMRGIFPAWQAANPEAARLLMEKRSAILRRPEMRQAAAEKARRQFASAEARQALSERTKRKYAKDPAIKARISAALGGKPIEAVKDGVAMRFSTLCECVRTLGLSLGNASLVLAGKRNHTGGYQLRRVAEAQ